MVLCVHRKQHGKREHHKQISTRVNASHDKQNSATDPTVMNNGEHIAVTDCVKYDLVIKTLKRRSAIPTKNKNNKMKGVIL